MALTPKRNWLKRPWSRRPEGAVYDSPSADGQRPGCRGRPGGHLALKGRATNRILLSLVDGLAPSGLERGMRRACNLSGRAALAWRPNAVRPYRNRAPGPRQRSQKTTQEARMSMKTQYVRKELGTCDGALQKVKSL